MERNTIFHFYPNLFLLVVLTCWKRFTFQISMKFHLKKRKIIFETSFPLSFDVLHSSPIVFYLPHETYLSGSTFIWHQKGPRKSQSIFPLSSRGWNTLPGACSNLHVDMLSSVFKKLNLCPVVPASRGVNPLATSHTFQHLLCTCLHNRSHGKPILYFTSHCFNKIDVVLSPW